MSGPLRRHPGAARPASSVLHHLARGLTTVALVSSLVAPTLAAAPAPAASSAGAKAGSAPAKAAAAKPADKRAAQKLLAQGNQLVGEGDYLGALDKFRGAYEKFSSPKILLNIGTTLRQLGRNVEAASIYEQFLADPEHDVVREKDVKRVLAEIDAVIGHILIQVDDPAATVRLDGKQLEGEAVGVSRRVEPGEHTVMAEKPGAAAAVQSVTVKPRQEHLVTLRFAPPPPKPEPPPSNTQRTLGLALGGVGALTMLAGAVVGGVAIAQSGDASAHCYKGGNACDSKGIELDQSAKTSATISTVGFAVGGAVLAAGGLIWLVSPAPAKERAPAAARWLSVAPQVGGAAISVGGAF